MLAAAVLLRMLSCCSTVRAQPGGTGKQEGSLAPLPRLVSHRTLAHTLPVLDAPPLSSPPLSPAGVLWCTCRMFLFRDDDILGILTE